MEELWIITNGAQYRLQKKDNINIELTFWLSDGTIKHFNTNYNNLFKMLDSSYKCLYNSKPL